MPANDRWEVDDVIAASRRPEYPPLEVTHGMTLTHTGSGTTGTVAGFSAGDRVVLVDEFGARKEFRAFDGAFTHRGVRVALRAATAVSSRPVRRTASGSTHPGAHRARTARASRLWVEGIHDAELIEGVWGDDLRFGGIVVEPMHGVDTLREAVAGFAPGPSRRLGVLLDHLVPGSKESQAAASVAGDNVLVRGHPYVDIWQSIRPGALGIDAWPTVGKGTPWKEGVIAALGAATHPAAFWSRVLDSVHSYRDLETPLILAVEELIDFVTVPAAR